MFDVVIIGCGIVGAATAYELSRYDLNIAVLERENDVAMGSTKANSAVLHSGYDPTPGSLMAKLDVEGVRLATELFKKLDVPHKQCGALVLALSEEEIKTVHHLSERAVANGVSDVSILTRDEVLRLEPNVSKRVAAALYAPDAMITDPWEYTLALAETAVRNGAELHLECEVTGIDIIKASGNGINAGGTDSSDLPGSFKLHTSGGIIETKTVVNAAGLYSDDIHCMVAKREFTVTPGKGEYWLLDKSEGTRVNNVLFQCPSAAGKGVLVTPTVHGNLLVGPGNIPVNCKDDTSTTVDELEYVRKTAVRSVPNIDFGAVIRTFSGNRAATESSDFIINQPLPGFVNLAGIKSPGLTAAPAIAVMASKMLADGAVLEFKEKKDFIDTRRHIRFNTLSPKEKTELISKDPLYGRMICRCETVSAGEIRDMLCSPIPPRSIDGVKRRTSAGMGRCQSGFCGPRVLELIAKHYGIDPRDVLQDKPGSNVLLKETKR